MKGASMTDRGDAGTEAVDTAAAAVEAEISADLDPRAGASGIAGFADAESREILNLLGSGASGGSCCGGSCCA